MADLPLRIETQLRNGDFAALFRQELGWTAPPSPAVPLSTAGVTADWLALRGDSGVFQISGEGSQTPPQLAQELRRQCPDPLVIWVHPDGNRSLWSWDYGQLTLMRQQLHPPITRLARLHQVYRHQWPTFAAALAPPTPPVNTALSTSFDILMAGLQQVPQPQRRYYGVLLFCRLVTLAAMQQWGLLNGDEWYLQNQFGQSQQRGSDRFLQEVLQPLWFQGLQLPPQERPRQLQERLIGIPYLAPGIFQRTDWEQPWRHITVADWAFEPLLAWLGDLAAEPGDLAEALTPALEDWVNCQRGQGFVTPAEVVEGICDRTLARTILDRARAITHQTYTGIADMLWRLSSAEAGLLLRSLLQLTLLDPACGSGRYLLAVMTRLEQVLAALMAITEMGQPLPSELTGNPLALRRHLLNQMGFGVDIWPEAVEITRLQLLLWLLRGVTSPQWLTQLPDPRMSVFHGNALIGLLTVDSERFDQVQPRGRQLPTPQALQGNLLQPLQAENYQSVLRERQIRLEDYRSQTYLLGESQDIPGYVQAEFLSDRIEQLNQVAQTKLNQLLLNELSRQLGLRYRYQDSEGKRHQRPLTTDDIKALTPLHWGFLFHSIIRQGGFDVIVCHPPAGAIKATPQGVFEQDMSLFERKGISQEAFSHNTQQLRAIDPDLMGLWQTHKAQLAFLSDCFRHLGDYRHATRRPQTHRQMRLYWERLYLERIVQLLKPGGRAALLLPTNVWHQSNSIPLREWLQQAVNLDAVDELPIAAQGAVLRSPALGLVSFTKGDTSSTSQQAPAHGSGASLLD